MPSDPDWVLYACYVDKTCLRNAVAYTVGQNLGRWNPRFRFVEVILNGDYVGLYNVVEKIKLDKNRLPLPAPAADAASGDLSGAYVGNAFSRVYPPEPDSAQFTTAEGLMYEVFRRAAAPHNMAFWW